MTIQESLFDLYEKCFPKIIRDADTVRKILNFPENQFIVEEIDGTILGAAVVNGGTILMLCVLPTSRKKGLGTMLLKLAEQCVLGNGYIEAKFCGGKDYITPGVPCVGPYAENINFFKKRGYEHSWGDAECVDMAMNLLEFNATEKVVGDTVDGVLYRWATKDDLDNVIECVEAGYPDFVEYYSDKNIYIDDASSGVESLVSGGPSLEVLEDLGLIGDNTDDLPEKVLLAIKDEKVCGALLVGNGTEMRGVGSVGCTVTHPDYRKQGIATNMVKLGTHHLKSLGLKYAFLGYTYTDIIPMYGKSGYKIYMKYFMGAKKL